MLRRMVTWPMTSRYRMTSYWCYDAARILRRLTACLFLYLSSSSSSSSSVDIYRILATHIAMYAVSGQAIDWHCHFIRVRCQHYCKSSRLKRVSVHILLTDGVATQANQEIRTVNIHTHDRLQASKDAPTINVLQSQSYTNPRRIGQITKRQGRRLNHGRLAVSSARPTRINYNITF